MLISQVQSLAKHRGPYIMKVPINHVQLLALVLELPQRIRRQFLRSLSSLQILHISHRALYVMSLSNAETLHINSTRWWKVGVRFLTTKTQRDSSVYQFGYSIPTKVPPYPLHQRSMLAVTNFQL